MLVMVALSPKFNAKQQPWRDSLYVFRVTNIWESAIYSDSLLGVFRVEPCVLVIWHHTKKIAVDSVVLLLERWEKQTKVWLLRRHHVFRKA